MKEKVGVVILNYNTWENTCNLAKNFAQMDCISDVVVVDNNSPNHSEFYIRDFLDALNSQKIHFIKSETNGGYAKGNNIGIRYLISKKCDYCIISNPDTIVDESSIRALIDSIINNNEYAILTTSRRNSDGTKISQYWDFPNFKTILLDCFALYRKYAKRNYHYEIDRLRDIHDIDVAPGSFFIADIDCLVLVNLMDEHTFLYFEENCLCKKIKDIGKKVGLLTNVEYIVKKGEASTLAVKKTGIGMKHYVNSETYYLKHYIKPNVFQFFCFWILSRYMIFQGRIKAMFLNSCVRKERV